jgi:hypothetical protein
MPRKYTHLILETIFFLYVNTLLYYVTHVELIEINDDK